jgi:hypothetical protein
LSRLAGTGLYVAKLDPSGACLWSKDAGNAGNQFGKTIAVDGAGNVLVTGYFTGSLSFGEGSIANAGNADFFLVKFDPTGGYVWSQRGGGATDDVGNGVALDGAGNVLVTGTFGGPADFGNGVLVNQGGSDVFIAKFSP